MFETAKCLGELDIDADVTIIPVLGVVWLQLVVSGHEELCDY